MKSAEIESMSVGALVQYSNAASEPDLGILSSVRSVGLQPSVEYYVFLWNGGTNRSSETRRTLLSSKFSLVSNAEPTREVSGKRV